MLPMLPPDAERALRQTVRSITGAALGGASSDWSCVRNGIRDTVEQELAAAVKRHNEHAPLAILREEELELVFGCLSFDFLLEVMTVCRRWYHTIVTSPRLWNSLVFPARNPCPTAATMERYMDRSRAAPLALMFIFPRSCDTAACRAYWRGIEKHVHHMSEIMVDHSARLVNTWNARDVDAALTRAAPNLEELGLVFTRTKVYNIPDNFLNGTPGVLRNLSLWNVTFPSIIPTAWANLTEILYDAPEVRRSCVLALYSCCPRLVSVRLSVANYRMDCEGDASIVPTLSSLWVGALPVLDQTLAQLADARHDRIPEIKYLNSPERTPPFWPAISQHRYTRASFFSYFTADGVAQLEFATEDGGYVRQTLRVPAHDVWAKLYDAAFLAQLVELEMAEEFWPMDLMPEAPALLTLTFVVGPRVGKFDITPFSSNFRSMSIKKLGRLICPKLRVVVWSVPKRRFVEVESYAAPPELPPLSGHVINRLLAKLTPEKKLEKIVFRGLTVDDISPFSSQADAIRYDAIPSLRCKPSLPDRVVDAVSLYMPVEAVLGQLRVSA